MSSRIIVVGIDPGTTKKNGVSIYEDGKLKDLHMWELMQIAEFITDIRDSAESFRLSFAIEDVMAYGGQYARTRGTHDSMGVTFAKGVSTGKVQWAQAECMRVIKWYGLECKLITPSKTNFHDDSGKFKAATGWPGKSNDDTRSAAWVGMMGI